MLGTFVVLSAFEIIATAGIYYLFVCKFFMTIMVFLPFFLYTTQHSFNKIHAESVIKNVNGKEIILTFQLIIV